MKTPYTNKIKSFTHQRVTYPILLFLIISQMLCVMKNDCAGQQSITWQRVYDGPMHLNDAATDICQSTDGNFYITGYTQNPLYSIYVLKITPYGDTLWTKYFGFENQTLIAHAILPTNDGGCILTGEWNQAFTIKLSSIGETIWFKNYGGTRVQCYDIKKTLDGEFILCGSINTGVDGYILKIDSLGNYVWSKNYNGAAIKVFSKIEDITDGGYLIIGSIKYTPYDTTRGYLVKINDSGNVKWEKTFKILTSTSCKSMIKYNSNYYIGGMTSARVNDSSKAYITKIDSDGNFIFTKIIETNSSYESLTNLDKTSSGNLILNTIYNTNTSPQIYKAKTFITDSNGVILVQKTFSNGKYDILRSSISLTNGDIIFAGGSESPVNNLLDIYVIRTDSMLNAPPISITNYNWNIPTENKLYQNYPNPFNSSTLIKFDIKNQQNNIKLILYDILGREVIRLFDSSLKPGNYEFRLNTDNITSGIYFYRLIFDNSTLSRKLVLLK